MPGRRIAIAVVFAWFSIGGIGHFWAADFFLKIIPPQLPYRMPAVYISGFFELAGALGLLLPALRKWAGIGLFALTLAVTPANVYMWLHPDLFASIPPALLAARLVLQVMLLATIWRASAPWFRAARPSGFLR
jgi:uncharacterized membrane protein